MKPETENELLKHAGVVTGNWDFSHRPDGHAHQTAAARIAAIGDKNVVSVFGALGIDTFPFTRDYKVRETIKDLAAKNYNIILVTEDCIAEIQDLIASFTSQPYPIIVPIPDGVTAKGIGHARIDANIKKVNMKGGSQK